MKIIISIIAIIFFYAHYYIMFENTDKTFLSKNTHTKQYIKYTKEQQDKLVFLYNDNNIELSLLWITKFKVLDTFFGFMWLVLVFFFILKFLNRQS